VDRELERVEGGYGLSAEKHFNALQRMIPGLRGLAIHDDDGRGRGDLTMGALNKLVWKRYEAENYFITPELLRTTAYKQFSAADLFHDAAETVLQELLLDQIFDGQNEDLENYNRADPSTQKTLWRAQTRRRKLSAFAEEYFRRFAESTGTPMLLRKGSLHELIPFCDASDLNGEVLEKLDAIQSLLVAPAGST
jgi:hypothetical protein